MRYDFKQKPIRRTNHFRKRNPVTFATFVPLIKISVKITLIVGLLLLGRLSWGKMSQKLDTVEFFHIKKMAFKGCVNSNEDDLYKISGVDEETSIFSLDLKKLSQNITKHPWVKEVSVKKQFPDKLYIGVEERTPIAMINLDNLYYVDSSGTVFKKLEKGDSTDLLVITGLSEARAFTNNVNKKGLLMLAIDLIKMLKERDAFSDRDFSEINLNKDRGITLFTYNKAIPIKVGFEFSHDRFDKLQKVFKELKKKALRVEYIDIDYDQKVVVKVAATV